MSGNDTIHHRDEELGAALRALDVPPHRPGFHAELHRRLLEERRTTLVPARQRRRARRTWLRRGARVAAVAAAAGIVLLAAGIPRTDRTPPVGGPEAATAAEIQAEVRAALTGLRSLSGRIVFDGPERGDERHWRFTLTAAGDFRLAGPARGEVVVYDASAGVTRSAQRSASVEGDDTLLYAVRRGVAPGPPDPGPPTWLLPDTFGAFVRALLAADDPRVRTVEHEGRPAWRLDVDTVPNGIVPEFTGDRFEITVDRETGMPVLVVERKGDAFLRELRLERLEVDGSVPPGAFRLAFPNGAEVMETDEGFRRVELGEAAAIVGYDPLVPAWLPKGYELAEVAVAEASSPPGTEAGNPPSRMVVSLSFRRGLDRFLVTTRLAGGHQPGRWNDPLATGEGFVDEPERLVLEAGALRGEEGELLLAPRGIPHLWTLTDDLVVTVGGDLARAELLRVAESLERRP